MEVEAADVAVWVREDPAFVLAANGPAGGGRILVETARYAPRHSQAGDRLIQNILGVMTSDPDDERVQASRR